MAIVIKEFGWEQATHTPYTQVATFRHEKLQHIYFLFFEWISPVIDRAEFTRIIQFTFNKFHTQNKFTVGLKSFANHLLAAFRELGLEEVDINFVIGKITKKFIRIAKFGQADIYMYKTKQIADLSTVVPINYNLNKLDYAKLPFEKGSLLFITNFGLFTSLLDNDMIRLSSETELLQDLESLKQEFLGTKTILMIADIQHTQQEHAEVVDKPTNPNNTQDIQDSQTTKANMPFKEDVTPVVTPVHKVGLSELEKDLRKFFNNLEQSLLFVGKGLKSIFARVYQGGCVIASKVLAYSSSLAKKLLNKKNKVNKELNERNTLFNTSAESPQELYKNTVGLDNVTTSNLKTPVDSQSHLQENIKQAATVNYADKYTNTPLDRTHNSVQPQSLPLHNTSSVATSTLDPVKYFRMRKSLWGRLYLKAMGIYSKLLRMGKQLLSRFKKQSSGGIVGKPIVGQIGGVVKPRKFSIKKLGVLAIVIVLVFIGVRQVKKIYTYKKQDIVYLQQANKQLNDLKTFYNKLSTTPSLQDPEHFNTCFTKIKETKSSLNKIKDSIHLADNQKTIDSLLQKADKFNNNCNTLYKKVFNVKQISEDSITVLKDFKTAFGENSNITAVAVYKGVLIVTDYGRGVVYQVNPENGKVSKLKDPKSLVKQPYSVGFGENKDGTPLIFVCDHQSGILYYVSGFGFKQIPGTDAVALGSKCMQVGGFSTYAYFVTEKGSNLYKAVNLGGGYAFPKPYITVKNNAKILDFAIDGSIYTLTQYVNNEDSGVTKQNNPYIYDIEKYFAGKPDKFSLTDADKQRINKPTLLYTNPSGYKPLYVYDSQAKYIFVLEKPTPNKHPGIAPIIKTIDISNIENGNIQDFAVDLSVNNNKEQYIYMIADNKLYKVKNP